MGDMGGVYTFYKNLTCQIVEKEQKQFETYLGEMLPEFSANGLFSRTGSGDDISVAGFVNVEIAKKFCEQFKLDIEVYGLKEELFWKEDELRGKMRKHGILLKRMNDAQDAIPKAQAVISDIEKNVDVWTKKQTVLESEIQKITLEIQEYEKVYVESEVKLKEGYLDSFLRAIGWDKSKASRNMDKARNSLQAQYNEKIEKTTQRSECIL